MLLSLLAVGALGSVISVGTFASFSATTSNAGNTFATGTLVLSDKVGTGSTCLSTNGGSTDTNANGGCSAMFSLATKKPGDASTVNMTIKNEGSLTPSTFKIYRSSACAASDASGESFHGTGDPCGSVDLYVQETASDFTTNVSNGCFYGGGSGGTNCSYSSSKTLSDFSTNYTNNASGLSLGPITAGTTRYFVIGVQLESNAGNSMQGRTATFGFTWDMEQ